MKKALAIILSLALLICACPLAVFAGTYPSNITDPGCVVRFENSLDWENVNIYAWDENGTELFGSWPGTPLLNYFEATNGKDVYYFTVPYEAVGIIFNSNSKDVYYQTADITNFNYDSYFYLDGTQDDMYHYLVKDYTEEYTYPDEDPTETTTPEPDPQKRRSVLEIADSLNIFGNAHLYAWDDDGEPIFGDWPGIELKNSYKNDFDETVYLCPVPKNAVGIIINNGSNIQSDDIDDFYNCDGYWFKGTRNDMGYYMATGYTIEREDDWIDPNGYFFLNTLAFGEVNEFAFDSEGNALLGSWPGIPLNDYTEDPNTGYEKYPLYCPEGTVGIVLSFGDGTQTQDISVYDLESYPVCWLDGFRDSDGHYYVSPFADYSDMPTYQAGTDPVPTEDTNPERKDELSIIDNFGWGTAYLYAWDSNGDDVLGNWPGKMITATENDYGENEFLCEIPKNAVGIVINNGQGAQSADITDFYNFDGYWFDGTKNEYGWYIPTGYVNKAVEQPTADNTIEPTEEPTENTSIEPAEETTSYISIEPTEETTDTQGGTPRVINITNNYYWETGYLYAWNKEGESILGDWPGTEITDTYVNGYGENIFVCTIPEDAIGIVINNGDTEQSEDITDFTYEGFWFDGTRDEMGHLIATGYHYDEDFPIPDAPVPEEFYFINSQNFIDVYLYAFDADGNSLSGDWPGSNKDEIFNVGVDTSYDVYYIDLPYNTYGFILSDGSSQRTEEVYQSITYKNAYWLDGSKDDYGNFLFKSYSGDIVPATNPKPEYKEVYVNDDLNWEAGYMYAWDENGDALTEQWPGDQVNKININGNMMFVCDIPVNAKGFIISDNDKSKTIDILDFDSYNAYRILNETDTKGNYKVEGYNFEHKIGDVNGDSIISVADATMVQQHAAELITLTGSALAAADTNHDGIVSVSDATLIQQFAAELIDSFD